MDHVSHMGALRAAWYTTILQRVLPWSVLTKPPPPCSPCVAVWQAQAAVEAHRGALGPEEQGGNEAARQPHLVVALLLLLPVDAAAAAVSMQPFKCSRRCTRCQTDRHLKGSDGRLRLHVSPLLNPSIRNLAAPSQACKKHYSKLTSKEAPSDEE